LKQAVPGDYFSFLGVASYGGWRVSSLVLVLVLSIIADPGRRLSMYSARSESGAKSSMVIGGAIVMVFSIVVGITGMYTYHLNPNLSNADQALPWLVMNVLPTWLAAVVVVSIASSIFSSANTNSATAGTFYVRHIYTTVMGDFPEKPLVVVRRALAVAFVLCTVLALYTQNIVQFVVRFLPLTMTGLAVIILMGRFWKRATWQGALAALIATPVVALIVMFVPVLSHFWKNPTIPATAAGLIIHFVVSLLTPPPQHDFDEIAKSLNEERQAIEGAPAKKSSNEVLSPI
jgi:SSS family solute:Na+ symporter